MDNQDLTSAAFAIKSVSESAMPRRDNVDEDIANFLTGDLDSLRKSQVSTVTNEPPILKVNKTRILFPKSKIEHLVKTETSDRTKNSVAEYELEDITISQRTSRCTTKNAFTNIQNILSQFFRIDFDMEVNSRCGVYCFLILISASLLSLPITMFPRYDLIQFPGYWPQELLPYTLICTAFSMHHMFETFLVTNNHEFLSARVLMMYLIIVSLLVHTEYISINILWIYYFKYHPPTPYIGQMCSVGLITSMCLAIWLLRPNSVRSDKHHRKRLKWYLVLLLTRVAIYQGYLFIATLFEKFSNKYQVVLAFTTPLMKYGNNWIQTKIVENSKGDNSSSAKFSVNCNVACTHALYLAIVIGSTATNLTSLVVCGLDAFLGILLCIKIYRQCKNPKTLSEDLRKCIEALVTKETLELLLPVSYCIIFALSYYGPNAEILGNVKADLWQYTKVEDIKTPLTKLGLFLLFDILRISAAAGVLWLTCKIDFFHEYCRLMGIYWKTITFNIFLYVVAVSIRDDIILRMCIFFQIKFKVLYYC